MSASRIGTLVLLVLVACLWAGSAIAQPAPAPAGAAEGSAGDETAQGVVSFFENLAQIAESNKANCVAMGEALNAQLDASEQMLRDASYTASSATPEQETAVLNAATQLGTTAGGCYEEEGVITFFDRFVTLTKSLDTP